MIQFMVYLLALNLKRHIWLSIGYMLRLIGQDILTCTLQIILCGSCVEITSWRLNYLTSASRKTHFPSVQSASIGRLWLSAVESRPGTRPKCLESRGRPDTTCRGWRFRRSLCGRWRTLACRSISGWGRRSSTLAKDRNTSRVKMWDRWTNWGWWQKISPKIITFLEGDDILQNLEAANLFEIVDTCRCLLKLVKDNSNPS